MTYGFLMDANNCIACHTCSAACKDANSYKLGCGFREVRSYAAGEFPEVKLYNVSIVARDGAFAPKTGEIARCNYCADIRAEGEQPACVAACPMRAIEWGDLDELVAKHPDKTIVKSFPALEATGEVRDECLYIVKECMLDPDYDEFYV